MANFNPVFETALEQLDTGVLASDALRVEEVQGFAYVVLRIRAGSAGAAEALAKLGLSLPDALGMTGTAETRLVKWISPDEYLITLPMADRDVFIQEAKAALEGVFSAVVDNTGAYSLLKISGTHRYDLLAKLCIYDLEGNLPVGKVVSTQLAKSPALFYRLEDESLMWMVRWSFADYAWRAVVHAAGEFGG